MKISVVIPMYNSISTIGRALESVLSQTFLESMEVIVVNDGSSDGCERVVEEIILNNKSIHTIKLINKKNGGVSSARNCGIKESSGDWIAFLDSDDIWHSNKIEKQVVEISKNERIKVIGTNRNGEHYSFFGKSKKEIFTLNAKEIIFKWYPHTSTVLVSKNTLIVSDLYDETRSHAEDGDLFLRISQYDELYVLNEDLVCTGGGKRSFGESGLSANMPKMYQGELLALRGAKKRNQINSFDFIILYFWLSFKYIRRIFIVRGSK